MGDGQAEDTAGEPNEKRLAQHLADHAPAACANREAQGNLLAARQRAREHEVRGVGASNQEDEADRAKEHKQRRANIFDEAFVQAYDDRAPALVVAWVLASEPVGDGRHFGLGSGERHIGLHPRDDPVVVVVAHGACLGRQGGRRPELREIRVPERRSHHADHRERLAAKEQCAANNRGIAAEAPRPQGIAEDHDLSHVPALPPPAESRARERAAHRVRRNSWPTLPRRPESPGSGPLVLNER